VAILFALLSALSYGVSDFTAGLASRRLAAGPVTGVTQSLGILTAIVAVALYPGQGAGTSALVWGAVSGVGSAVGTLSLYHGFSVAPMSVVATLSGVLTAVLPVVAGLALGNHLSAPAAAGIVIAMPAIGFVSWRPSSGGAGGDRAGVLYGVLAGIGFGTLFVALDRAGTRSGAWPLLPGQVVSLLLVSPFAYRGLTGIRRPSANTMLLLLGTGVLSATANLLFLVATKHGELAIVGVLSALYPVLTVLLARVLLTERWSRTQAVGLATAALAVVLVTLK
jgi:drug/metabolite transporter (DMT)-like permease